MFASSSLSESEDEESPFFCFGGGRIFSAKMTFIKSDLIGFVFSFVSMAKKRAFVAFNMPPVWEERLRIVTLFYSTCGQLIRG